MRQRKIGEGFACPGTTHGALGMNLKLKYMYSDYICTSTSTSTSTSTPTTTSLLIHRAPRRS